MTSKIYTRQLPLHRQSERGLPSPSHGWRYSFRLEQRFADPRISSITINQLPHMLVNPGSPSNG